MSVQHSAPYDHGVNTVDEKKLPYTEDTKGSSDIESGEVSPVYDDDGPVEFEEKKDLRRGLKQRHIQMVGLYSTVCQALTNSKFRLPWREPSALVSS